MSTNAAAVSFTRGALLRTAVLLSAAFACGQPSQRSDTHGVTSADSAKAIVRRAVEEIWNRANLAAADELIADDFIDHTPLPGQLPGRAGFKQVMRTIRVAFPDARETIEELVAEGDRVVARVVIDGTHTGPFMGVPPTGKRIHVPAVAILRVRGGQIVERWSYSDDVSLLLDLDALKPSPGFNPHVLP